VSKRLLPFGVLNRRRPRVRRFEIATEPTSQRDVRACLIARNCQFEFAVRTFRGSRPYVKGDVRTADEEEPFSILLCQLPALRKRRLGVRSCGDEVGIIVLAIKEAHEREHVT
jgi:hypothetical protein